MSAINEIKEWLNEKEGKAFLKDYFKDMKNGSTPLIGKDYTKSFYYIIGYLSWIFLIFGILSAVLIFFSTGDIFKATAVIFLLVWLIVFLRYFVWAVYHYNINYGLTSNDWVKIAEAREKKLRGEDIDEKETEEPAYNPYRSQTFGLPPGTVRGMIAFTLLFGSITILVASMGMGAGDLQNSLIRDQFEFFKTAFLMMIAFYFGDKSLKFLQKRWKNPNGNTEGGTENETTPTQNSSEIKSDLDSDDDDFLEQDRVFGKTEEPENAPAKSPTTILKNAMHKAIKPDKGSVAEKKSETLLTEFPHVSDSIHSKVLSDEQIKQALADLQEKDGIQLQFPVLKAIIEVESGGSGHLSDGRAKILFEGHKFWQWLTHFNINPEALQAGNENILYREWTRKFYRVGAQEYFRFDKARKIHEKSAIYSTSWGLFQILGENLEHNIKSRLNPDKDTNNKWLYDDELDFVNKQNKSEYYHLLDFLAFVKTKTSQGKKLIDYVSGNDERLFDWAKFAYGYNGSGYKINKYDEKLQRAYSKYSQGSTVIPSVNKQRIPIIDAGHGGIDANGNYTTGNAKRYTFTGENQNGLEIFEGVVNRKIAQKLIEKLKAANLPYYDLNSTDTSDMSLEERVRIANEQYSKNKYYYYLSIHSNSASKDLKGKGTTAHGFEIFTSKGTTTSDLFAKTAAGVYEKHFPQRTFRGLKEADYYVLKHTACPAFLVENLFFDNFDEAQYLLSDVGQQAIADCLFEAVQKIS